MTNKTLNYATDLYRVSPQFLNKYPAAQYPEILRKAARPYNCLLIDLYDNFFICVPYRSNITHNNAYKFKNSNRSQTSPSGLDYQKMLIIEKSSYLDDRGGVVVDQDEYNETKANMDTIVSDAVDYLQKYIDHITGKRPLHPRDYDRRYKYSTLPYFHDILGI